jgi:hypothetical protein
MARPSAYPTELGERAVRMVAEIRPNYSTECGLGFLRGRARPAVEALVAFIDAHRQVFGVEPICRVLTSHGLKIATSTYYAAKTRTPAFGERSW